MDNQRIILLVALAFVFLLIWQAWETEQRAKAPAFTTTTAPSASTGTAGAKGAVPERDVPSVPSAPAAADADALPRATRVVVTTDLLRAELDTTGGDLRTLDLLTYSVSTEDRKPVRLLNDTGADLFVVQTGLLGKAQLPTHKSAFRAAATNYTLAAEAQTLEVPLVWEANGLRVVKTYVFHRDSFLIDVRFEVENRTAQPTDAFLYAQLQRTHIAQEYSIFMPAPSYIGGVVSTPTKKYEKYDFEDMADKPLKHDARGGWAAMLQHYFFGALIPPQQADVEYYSERLAPARYALGYKSLTPIAIAPGARAQLQTTVYAGPKEQTRLDAIGKTIAPGLQLTVDYGVLTIIADPLYWTLAQFHRLVGNWGWAIVLLTFLIKLVFYPLSGASYRSMGKMRQLQPRLQALKERHGGDRQKMNEAMMELYRKEKINPLGGCLPILVQIPVFIALYWVLLESVELRQAPWILWINDLSAPDPFFVLPIIMGASMLVQTWLNPAPLEPIQQKIMYAMPVVFTVFFLFFASGLVLYWTVNNILSIAQQWWMTRTVDAKPAGAGK